MSELLANQMAGRQEALQRVRELEAEIARLKVDINVLTTRLGAAQRLLTEDYRPDVRWAAELQIENDRLRDELREQLRHSAPIPPGLVKGAVYARAVELLREGIEDLSIIRYRDWDESVRTFLSEMEDKHE